MRSAERRFGLPNGIDAGVATDLLTERLRAWIGDDAAIFKGRSGCREISHNLKVVGSNPTPATNIYEYTQ